MILNGGEIDLPNKTIHELLIEECLKHHAEDPENIAFMTAENRKDAISFKQVVEYSIITSEWFIQNGFKKGDVVLIATNNNWRYVTTCIGAWRAGLIVSGSCPQFTEYEFQYQISDSTAKILFCDSATMPTLRKASPTHRIVNFDSDEFARLLATTRKNLQMPNISLDDLLYLPYSSGTTGKPKGVMITQKNFVMMIEANVKKLRELTAAHGLPEDFTPPHDLHFLPLYHAMGMFRAIICCYRGATQIMFNKFRLELMLQLIEEFNILAVQMVPAVLVRLVSSPLLHKYDISSLISIAVGSAPLPDGAVQKLKQVLPDVRISQGYGMTEMTFATHLPGPESPEGSVGKLVAGTFMKVKKEDGSLCGVKEQGECWIKGPQVMKGYWRKEELMKDLIDEDGFMRTGDIVYFDENGDTFICDRIKELIKVNGKQVAPAELESICLEAGEVVDVCVFGIDDATSGEAPIACVVVAKNVAKSPKTAQKIQKAVNSKLARYKHLKRVEFVEIILRTATGKILRRHMKENYLKERKSKI